MPNMNKLMIVAGEASGDVNGAALALALKRLAPDLKLVGIGGKQMREAGVEVLFDVTGLAVVGFTEVVRNLRKFRNIFCQFRDRMIEEKPVAVVLLDYPGFNIRLAAEAKKNQITVIYYISPQVWAWGRNRVKKLARVVDQMLVIFPFEKDFYKDSGLNVEFVGHPMLDRIKPDTDREKLAGQLSLSSSEQIVALLPGSRKQEVKRLLPVMLKASAIMRKEIADLQFIIPCASTIDVQEVRNTVEKYPFEVAIVENRTCDAINVADLVIASSGTATVESACLMKPMVVVYQVSFLTWLTAKFLIKVKNIAMVNVIAGRKVVPELLQFQATPAGIAGEALSLLRDKTRQEKMKEDLKEVAEALGSPGASDRAARAILRTIGRQLPDLSGVSQKGE
jgi:lipid-A-disaccharide synthase